MTTHALLQSSYYAFSYGFNDDPDALYFGDEDGGDFGDVEQCVMEFNINPQTLDLSGGNTVELTFDTTFGGTFTKYFRRWSGAFPTTQGDMQNPAFLAGATGQVSWSNGGAGSVTLDITSLASHAKTQGDTLLRIGIPETSEGQYQQGAIDRNAGSEPEITYTVASGSNYSLVVDNIEVQVENEAVDLSRSVGLTVNNIEVQVENESLPALGTNIGIVPQNIEIAINNDNADVVVDNAINTDCVCIRIEIEEIAGLTVHAGLSVDSFTVGTEITASANAHFGLAVDDIELDTELRGFAVTSTIGPISEDVGLCTPTDLTEETDTSTAGEAIAKGDLITVSAIDMAYLSVNSDPALAIHTGFALTDAAVGEPVFYVRDGVVLLGAVLKPNTLYCVSGTKGRIMPIEEIAAGDYISIVGVSLTDSSLRMGNDFRAVQLLAVSEDPPTNAVITATPADVRLDSPIEDIETLSLVGAVDIQSGDAVSRSQGLSKATNATDAQHLGIAISDALAACTVGVATRGDVVLGSGLLDRNMIYVLSRTDGRFMAATDLQAGDFLTIAGIALDTSTMRLGPIEPGLLAT